MFIEFCKYGEILDMLVADNIGDHMMGNLYIKFATEEQASLCYKEKIGKYFNNI